MKKEDMTCCNCEHYVSIHDEELPEINKTFPDVKSGDGACFRHPLTLPTLPGSHCGDGTWFEWNERYHEWVPYYWGEWEKEPPKKGEQT